MWDGILGSNIGERTVGLVRWPMTELSQRYECNSLTSEWYKWLMQLKRSETCLIVTISGMETKTRKNHVHRQHHRRHPHHHHHHHLHHRHHHHHFTIIIIITIVIIIAAITMIKVPAQLRATKEALSGALGASPACWPDVACTNSDFCG